MILIQIKHNQWRENPKKNEKENAKEFTMSTWSGGELKFQFNIVYEIGVQVEKPK